METNAAGGRTEEQVQKMIAFCSPDRHGSSEAEDPGRAESPAGMQRCKTATNTYVPHSQ